MKDVTEAAGLRFVFIGVRKAARGDWFFGPMGALFPWTHAGPSKEEHRIYRLEVD